MLSWRLAPFAFLFLAGASVHSQQARPRWQDLWDAKEEMVAMRDGVKLHTVYFVPKGKTGPFPILLERTPYGAGSSTRPPQRSTPKIAQAGYILAYQDVRGRGPSEGEFIDVRPTRPKGQAGIDETTDTFDTVEYLINHVPSNSKRVGLWGISYPGFYAGVGAIRNHPALKAVSPQAPVNDWFMGDDVTHRGAMYVQETFDFIQFFNLPKGGKRPEVDREGLSAYDFFLKAGALSNYEGKFFKGALPYWKELIQNDTYNQYWKDRALWRSFSDVKCAVLTVGGLFDKEDQYGALKLYSAGEKQNPGTANFLVMGPWSHGQWASPSGGASLADLAFGEKTSQWYQENVEFPFFERYLRGDQSVPAPAEATVFETGANKWQKFEFWPPHGMKHESFYCDSPGTLSRISPKPASKTEYVYDPAKPTPYLADFANSKRAPGDWLARDQKFLEGRSDTAIFRLPALTEDYRVAGPIKADFWITTTGTDADLVVQIIDEYPKDATETKPNGDPMGGHQMMVRGEIMKVKFRESWEKPMAMKPGQPTRVTFELNDVLHTFKKGHTIAVRVMSSWFPLAERNPNKFVSRSASVDADFKPATITILTGGNSASRVEFGFLPK